MTSTNIGDFHEHRRFHFVGTPAWIAPEQATGDEITAATDVFAWAGIVVFAATGQPPFGTGRPEAVLSRILSGGPAADYDQLAGPLRELVRAALARDPRQRPSARALRDDLAGTSPAGTSPAVSVPAVNGSADSDRAADGTQAAPAESATAPPPTVTIPVRPTAVAVEPPLPATVHDQPVIPARPARWARPAVLGAAVVVVAGATIAGILAAQGAGTTPAVPAPERERRWRMPPTRQTARGGPSSAAPSRSRPTPARSS
ncbi:protein kinase domain-containing protein [Frankia sp. CiP1_Cm_nod2]|uniref:protein kinase domain-containing protein n=1 Tax=Frankia sp. CiP1_Cm_nod2 TaxID=2897161 RepID=UPI002023DCCC